MACDYSGKATKASFSRLGPSVLKKPESHSASGTKDALCGEREVVN